MGLLKGWKGVGLIVGAYLLSRNMHSGKAGKNSLTKKTSLQDTLNSTWKATQSAIGASVSNIAKTTVNTVQQMKDTMTQQATSQYQALTSPENGLTITISKDGVTTNATGPGGEAIKAATNSMNTNVSNTSKPGVVATVGTGGTGGGGTSGGSGSSGGGGTGTTPPASTTPELDKLPITIDGYTFSSWSHESTTVKTVVTNSSCLTCGAMIVALTKIDKDSEKPVYMKAYEVKKTIDAQRKYIKDKLEIAKDKQLISNEKYKLEKAAINDSSNALDAYVDKNTKLLDEQAQKNQYLL